MITKHNSYAEAAARFKSAGRTPAVIRQVDGATWIVADSVSELMNHATRRA